MTLRNSWLHACMNQEPQVKPEAPPTQESLNLPAQEPALIDEPPNTGDIKPSTQEHQDGGGEKSQGLSTRESGNIIPNTQEHEAGKLPTLEEYVAAGYKAENYDKFIERVKNSGDLIDSLDSDTGDFTPSNEPTHCKS